MPSKIYNKIKNHLSIFNFIRMIRYKLRNRGISLGAKIIGNEISLGKNISLPSGCILSTQSGGKIILGDNVSFGTFAQILTFGGDVIIGDNVTIGEFSILHGHGGLVIGNDCLIGPHTINTIPPETIKAFCDHGHPQNTLEQGLSEAQHHLQEIKALGIDLNSLCGKIQDAGVAAFQDSFNKLILAIKNKAK